MFAPEFKQKLGWASGVKIKGTPIADILLKTFTGAFLGQNATVAEKKTLEKDFEGKMSQLLRTFKHYNKE